MLQNVSLDEPIALTTAAKVVSVISIGLNILAMYLVLTRSATLRTYSWFLVNYMVRTYYHFWKIS